MEEGLVIKAAGNLYSLRCDNGEMLDCRIKGKLRIQGLKSTNPVTVGDRVKFEKASDNQVGAITEILERKNYIIRKSTNLSKQHHIIAANIDQALLVVSIINPETPFDFVDRYLVSAEAFRIPVILVFNKFDIYKDAVYEQYIYMKTIYGKIGYQCIETSVQTKHNIDQFSNLLQGKISIVSGNSGVGKSSLIQAVDPSLNLKIGQLSDYHKSGMHTTSYSEMFPLTMGGYIIDTPGIRAFGLIDFGKDELYHFFPEIFKLSEKCKFYNCTHIHEPDCAVIEAYKTGELAFSRYSSYFNIYNDKNEKYRF